MPAVAATTAPPVVALRREPEAMEETVRFVVEAVSKKPVPETVSAVEEAYGNTFATVAFEVMMPEVVRVPVTASAPPSVKVRRVVPLPLTPVVRVSVLEESAFNDQAYESTKLRYNVTLLPPLTLTSPPTLAPPVV